MTRHLALRTMMRTRLAWGLAVTNVAVFFAAVALGGGADISVIVLFALGIGGYVGVGALLASRVPGNPIGWLLIATGTWGTVAAVIDTYVHLGGQQSPAWPGVEAAERAREAIFLYPVLIALVLIPLVFPDGRLLSGRFRWVVLMTVAAMVGWMLGSVFVVSADLVVVISVPIAFGGAITAVILRFRRGDPVQREQVKWLAAVVVVGATSVLSGLMLNGLNATLGNALVIVGMFALLTLPFVIAIAILRYRLYEIDRIISRSLAYLVVTGLLIGVYAGIVVLIGGPLAGVTGGDTISVAVSTLAVAALFQPLRRRVQSVVDRRFDRARFDAERTSAAFSERLRDEVDIGAVTADLDATIRTALRPASLGLWLRPEADR